MGLWEEASGGGRTREFKTEKWKKTNVRGEKQQQVKYSRQTHTFLPKSSFSSCNCLHFSINFLPDKLFESNFATFSSSLSLFTSSSSLITSPLNFSIISLRKKERKEGRKETKKVYQKRKNENLAETGKDRKKKTQAQTKPHYSIYPHFLPTHRAGGLGILFLLQNLTHFYQ